MCAKLHVGLSKLKPAQRSAVSFIISNAVTSDDVNKLEKDYLVRMATVLSDYYSAGKPAHHNKIYFRLLASGSYVACVDEMINRMAEQARNILGLISRAPDLRDLLKYAEGADNTEISMQLVTCDYEMCECGQRRTQMPDTSELVCPACGRVKTMVGVIFRDDQFYTQDGQKTKHSGYDTSRHYRFWMDRLQAIETKSFAREELAKIEYVIGRDKYNKYDLTCEVMRRILKDPQVSLTRLNNHVPLLIKTFGGRPPPTLTFQENQLCAAKFSLAMSAYTIVNPSGGNKPYYPYFIYKILYVMLADGEKIRILDYIHLQSRETVTKNDILFKKICDYAHDPVLVYTPTDPMGRIY
jgi:predicted nucleic acid-binding Zn ribbon protein